MPAEVALFDAPATTEGPLSWLKALDWVRPPAGRRARRVDRHGLVITDHIAGQAPPAEVVWACQDVFHRANRSHVTWRRMTPLRFGSGGPAVAHWTCPLPLRAADAANVYTVHDLVPLRLPFATLDRKAAFHDLCREILARADHVVTVSETTRRDILSTFKIAEDRITTTYQSVRPHGAASQGPDEEVERQVAGVFGLPWKGYFLFFGGIEPKKNLARLIEAHLSSGVSTPLVIVGGQAWLDGDETRLLYDDLVVVRTIRDGAIRRQDRIRRYDYLPPGLLVSLVRGARATLFPSLYEGFGLPVLESMQLGTPVLASTGGALPEIAGDAALLVDPYDVDAITQGLRTLDADADLRTELARRGRERALVFSPENHQRRLAAVYEAVA
ncbi:glycosyltransferase family 4 protein [Caulobacter sp. KR2-114]|uniref:glycosyltransferase family 4 protein n=1 Tax=Caulobacter sp. KR2-114 TaxID=3400912 RepID=UPI003BFEFED8